MYLLSSFCSYVSLLLLHYYLTYSPVNMKITINILFPPSLGLYGTGVVGSQLIVPVDSSLVLLE